MTPQVGLEPARCLLFNGTLIGALTHKKSRPSRDAEFYSRIETQ